jgi:hypothetical protein
MRTILVVVLSIGGIALAACSATDAPSGGASADGDGGSSADNSNDGGSSGANPDAGKTCDAGKTPVIAGTKFESTSKDWSVPATGGFSPGGYSQASATRWSTFDIDGDGKPDLVSSSDSVNGADIVWGAGASTHWRVFRNVP